MFEFKIIKPRFLKKLVSILISLLLSFPPATYAKSKTTRGQEDSSGEWLSVDLARNAKDVTRNYNRGNYNQLALASPLGQQPGVPGNEALKHAKPLNPFPNQDIDEDARSLGHSYKLPEPPQNSVDTASQDNLSPKKTVLTEVKVKDAEKTRAGARRGLPSSNTGVETSSVAEKIVSRVVKAVKSAIKAATDTINIFSSSVSASLNNVIADWSDSRATTDIEIQVGHTLKLPNGVTVENTGTETARVHIRNGNLTEHISGNVDIASTGSKKLRVALGEGFGGNSYIEIGRGSAATVSISGTNITSTSGNVKVHFEGKGTATPTFTTADGMVISVVPQGKKSTWNATITLNDGKIKSVKGPVSINLTQSSQTEFDLSGLEGNIELLTIGAGQTVDLANGISVKNTGTGPAEISMSEQTETDLLPFFFSPWGGLIDGLELLDVETITTETITTITHISGSIEVTNSGNRDVRLDLNDSFGADSWVELSKGARVSIDNVTNIVDVSNSAGEVRVHFEGEGIDRLPTLKTKKGDITVVPQTRGNKDVWNTTLTVGSDQSITVENGRIRLDVTGQTGVDLSKLRGNLDVVLGANQTVKLANGITVTGQDGTARVQINNGRLVGHISGNLQVATDGSSKAKISLGSNFGNNSYVTMNRGSAGTFTITDNAAAPVLDFSNNETGKFTVHLKGTGTTSPTILTRNGEISLIHTQKKKGNGTEHRWSATIAIENGNYKTTINGKTNVRTIADTPPVDTPPVDTPPVDTPPVDTPPVDTPPVDTPPVDTPPVDTPPVDTPPVDTPPVDTPPTGTSSLGDLPTTSIQELEDAANALREQNTESISYVRDNFSTVVNEVSRARTIGSDLVTNFLADVLAKTNDQSLVDKFRTLFTEIAIHDNSFSGDSLIPAALNDLNNSLSNYGIAVLVDHAADANGFIIDDQYVTDVGNVYARIGLNNPVNGTPTTVLLVDWTSTELETNILGATHFDDHQGGNILQGSEIPIIYVNFQTVIEYADANLSNPSYLVDRQLSGISETKKRDYLFWSAVIDTAIHEVAHMDDAMDVSGITGTSLDTEYRAHLAGLAYGFAPLITLDNMVGLAFNGTDYGYQVGRVILNLSSELERQGRGDNITSLTSDELANLAKGLYEREFGSSGLITMLGFDDISVPLSGGWTRVVSTVASVLGIGDQRNSTGSNSLNSQVIDHASSYTGAIIWSAVFPASVFSRFDDDDEDDVLNLRRLLETMTE